MLGIRRQSFGEEARIFTIPLKRRFQWRVWLWGSPPANKAHSQDDSGMFWLNTVFRAEGAHENTVIIFNHMLRSDWLAHRLSHSLSCNASERSVTGAAKTTKWNLLISTFRCFFGRLWNAFFSTCNKKKNKPNMSACDSWAKWVTEKARAAPRPETRHSSKSYSRKNLISERPARQRTTKWEECRTIGVAAEDKVTHLSPWSDRQTAALGYSDTWWSIYTERTAVSSAALHKAKLEQEKKG